jgi:hypothetical protein
MFTPASKEATKLRVAILGPSGAGKTMTALRLAKGIGGRIALIDSERRSASKYANHPRYGFQFDTHNLPPGGQTVADYITAISGAAEMGYEVLIIDSLSHAWQELVAEVELLAKSSRHKGNTFSAWSEGTPKQKGLINAILDYPGHVIATMRSKTAWAEGERNGRKSLERIGLAPEQGKGIEYEFDMLMEITPDHVATFLKDRSDMFQDKNFLNPGEDLGRQMAEWLEAGTLAQDPGPDLAILQNQALEAMQKAGLTDYGIAGLCLGYGTSESIEGLPVDILETIVTDGLSAETIARCNGDEPESTNG